MSQQNLAGRERACDGGNKGAGTAPADRARDALVAIGANLPLEGASAQETCMAAVERMGQLGQVRARSGWWQAPAWPDPTGPAYVNGVVRLATPLSPSTLLRALQEIERSFGRTRDRRWGARTLDLDVIDVDGVVVSPTIEEGLRLPHPRAHQRGFVLAPLRDVAPLWRHPIFGRSVEALLAALPAHARAGLTRLSS